MPTEKDKNDSKKFISSTHVQDRIVISQQNNYSLSAYPFN